MDISSWASVGIHWNGNASFGGVPAGFVQGQDAPGAVTLEGDQCLVFFLGGIPGTGPSCLGFAADPKNPANPSSADRIGPFFEFTTSRLVALRAGIVTPWAGANTYYSYADTFSSTDGQGTLLAGAPYAYFSCYKVRNGYNRYNNFTPPGTYTPAIPFGVSDCYTTLTVSPYLQTTSQWQKPTSFQILSAGADGFFGNAGGTSAALWGGIWTPQTAATVYPQGSSGYDDQANFTSGLLGAGAD